MGHVQRKCAGCRRSVTAGTRGCPTCGERQSAYVARYRGPDGRERSKTFARKLDAERYLNAQETSKDSGEWLDPRHSLITLDAFWLEQRDRPGKRGTPAASTIAKWDTVYRRYLAGAFGSQPLAAITRKDIET